MATLGWKIAITRKIDGVPSILGVDLFKIMRKPLLDMGNIVLNVHIHLGNRT